MAKSSTYAQERAIALLKTNASGDKQFGARDQFKKLEESLGTAAAVAWAQGHIAATIQMRTLLAATDWLGFDSETTSTGDAAGLCEVAFVRPDRSIAFESLIRPRHPITDGSAAIHGITNAMVEDSPTLPDVHARFQKLLDECAAVLWYNGEFDQRVANQSCFAHGLPLFRWPATIDIMPFAAEWLGDWNPRQNGWRWPKLEGGHRAAGDVIAMIDLMTLMASSNVEYVESLCS
jgi:DNA polymerase III alpha subunit (gram-positive type)